MKAAGSSMLAGLILAAALWSPAAQCGLMPADLSERENAVALLDAATTAEENLIVLALSQSAEPTIALPSEAQDSHLLAVVDTAELQPGIGKLGFDALPEPGTLSLFGLALLAWGLARHWRQK